MPLGFLRKLFSDPVPPDPTADWPAADGATPEVEVDVDGGRIGRLKFAGPLADARYLGRPTVARHRGQDALELTYAAGGFCLDFEEQRLAHVAFFIGPDDFEPSIPGLRHCSPRLRDKATISARTTREELEQIFGAPRRVDERDNGDVILTYCRPNLIFELELNVENTVKRWNLFPENDVML